MTTQPSSSIVRRRGGDTNPVGTRYSLWEWTKGYLAWIAVFPLYCALWAFATVFKRLPAWMVRKLLRWHERVTDSRTPDVRIPGDPDIPPYMLRWWAIRRNAFFNIYVHIIRRSDDDTALHDHPWWNFSIVLEGEYTEHLIREGGVHTKKRYGPGAVRFRPSGAFAHRLELDRYRDGFGFGMDGEERPVFTIFITGPVLRRWGFHHPLRWVDAYEWDEFLATNGINSMRMDGYAAQNAPAARKLDN